MDDFDAKAFGDAFLQANARPEFIAAQFAEVIRYLIRAIAAGDSSGALYSASEKMKYVQDLILKCPDRLSWYAIFSDAISQLKDVLPDDQDERRYVDAARRGSKYLVELTSTDGFGSARASKALDAFQQAIRWSQEAQSKTRYDL